MGWGLVFLGVTGLLTKNLGLKPRPSGRLFFLQPIYPVLHKLGHGFLSLLSNTPKLVQPSAGHP
jgi:hypothetical protein